MKLTYKFSRIFLCLIMVFSVFSKTQGQTTVTFQPDATAGIDAFAQYYINGATNNTNNNYGTYIYVTSARKTATTPYTNRSFVKFDLTSIPSNATITSANLTLSGIAHDASRSNASYFQRVDSVWNENTITWNNQPRTSTTNQISLAASTSATQNYVLDVKTHVQSMIQNSQNNYGWMLRLQDEGLPYASLVFASSDYTTATQRPKLAITYFVLNVSANTTISSGSATLTASGATTYTWAPAASLSASTGASVYASPTATTTYTITGTTGGNSGTTTVTVTVNQSINQNFQKVYKDIIDADPGAKLRQTADDGFIMGGSTASSGIHIIKTDKYGNVSWSKYYTNGASYKSLYDLQPTTDGGYIFLTERYTGSISHTLIVKTDASGNTSWVKELGAARTKRDAGGSIQQTADGGYIISGHTFGYGSDAATGSKPDLYLSKLSSTGVLQWSKTYGNAGVYEYLATVTPTIDGGYILTGDDGNSGNNATILIKTDQSGNIQWSKHYTGLGFGGYNKIPARQTTDQGYIMGGSYNSNYGALLIKTDVSGNMVWSKVYQNVAQDGDRGVEAWPTPDGGYAFLEVGSYYGNRAYLVKTNSTGTVEWSRSWISNQATTEGPVSLVLLNNQGYGILQAATCSGCAYSDFTLMTTDPIGLGNGSSCVDQLIVATTLPDITVSSIAISTGSGPLITSATVSVGTYATTVTDVCLGHEKPPLVVFPNTDPSISGCCFANYGASVYVSDNSHLNIYCNLVNELGGSNTASGVKKGEFRNKGHLNVKLDWVHNAQNDLFLTQEGITSLFGADQKLRGNSSTHFNELDLSGNGIKQAMINEYVNNNLVLTSNELALGNNVFFMENSASAISRTSGFVSTDGIGYLSRNMTGSGAYLFPMGSKNAGIFRYRPVEISNTSFNDQVMVNFVNTPPTSPFNIGDKAYNVLSLNNLYYHNIKHTNSSATDKSIKSYYPATEGQFQSLAHWEKDPAQLNYWWGSTSGSNSNTVPSVNPNTAGLIYAETSGAQSFDGEPFILAQSGFYIKTSEFGNNESAATGSGATITVSAGTGSTSIGGGLGNPYGTGANSGNNGIEDNTIIAPTPVAGLYVMTITPNDCGIPGRVEFTIQPSGAINSTQVQYGLADGSPLLGELSGDVYSIDGQNPGLALNSKPTNILKECTNGVKVSMGAVNKDYVFVKADNETIEVSIPISITGLTLGNFEIYSPSDLVNALFTSPLVAGNNSIVWTGVSTVLPGVYNFKFNIAAGTVSEIIKGQFILKN